MRSRHGGLTNPRPFSKGALCLLRGRAPRTPASCPDLSIRGGGVHMVIVYLAGPPHRVKCLQPGLPLLPPNSQCAVGAAQPPAGSEAANHSRGVPPSLCRASTAAWPPQARSGLMGRFERECSSHTSPPRRLKHVGLGRKHGGRGLTRVHHVYSLKPCSRYRSPHP